MKEIISQEILFFKIETIEKINSNGELTNEHIHELVELYSVNFK